jgi:hypothetical protein
MTNALHVGQLQCCRLSSEKTPHPHDAELWNKRFLRGSL